MSMRVHTTHASAVAVSVLHETRLVELYGPEFAGHGPALVIEDTGNCEAMVLYGDHDDVAQLGADITARAR